MVLVPETNPVWITVGARGWLAVVGGVAKLVTVLVVSSLRFSSLFLASYGTVRAPRGHSPSSNR